MKNLIKPILALSLMVAIVACGNENKTEETAEEVNTEVVSDTSVSINASESNIKWRGQIVGGLKEHYGNIKLTEGEVVLNGDQLVGGTFTVDMSSINPTDSNYTEDKPAKALVGHLSTGDFFMVDSFPKAMFVIKNADLESNTVTGDLTIRGVTKEETIENVKVDIEAGMATGKLTFDRQDYNVSFETGAKDFVLSDEIELDIMLKM